MKNRENLKLDTRTLHERLESLYPFDALLKKENIEVSTRDFIWCINSVFMDLINFKKNEDPFYGKLSSILNQSGSNIAGSRNELNRLDILATEYVLLGSRMGNQIILNKNPLVKEVSFKDYFTLEFPIDNWKKVVMDIESLSPIEIDFVIEKARSVFDELIQKSKKFRKRAQAQSARDLSL